HILMENGQINGVAKDTLVTGSNSQGIEFRATLLKLSRFQVSFELYGPPGLLRASEVISGFRIISLGEAVYAGRAVISNLISLGSVTICEATLEEASLNLAGARAVDDSASLKAGFESFIQHS